MMSEIHRAIRGKVLKFGDSVDGNPLAGREILISSNSSENLKTNRLRGVGSELRWQVKAGDVPIASKTLGSRSNRHLKILQTCSIEVVFADSVERIHGQNSLALALPKFLPLHDRALLKAEYPALAVRNLASRCEKPPPSFPETFELAGVFQVIANQPASRGIYRKTHDGSH